MVTKFEEKKASSDGEDNKGPAFGKRHVQVILMFFLITFAYAMRVNLSVAIVAMTDNMTSPNPDVPTYDWTDKSVILSSFYWGYIMLQIFAGKLGRTYGTKWFLVGAMAVNSTAFTLIPLLADLLGSKGVMGCRMIQGLAQGFVYPSIAVLFGQWIPPEERSRLITITFSGLAVSNVASQPIAGYICASWAGWPATFYLFGALGFAWMLPWMILGSNSPAEDKTITEEERTYIQKSLDFEKGREVLHTPWKPIMTSLPVWAFIISNYGQSWGFSALLTEMPTYISKIMKFDMHSNSLLSAAPYAALFVVSYICGFLSDHIINSGLMSRTRARNLFTTIGQTGPALSLIILGFAPESATTASVTLLIAAVGLSGAGYSGYMLNGVDLSPTFSGVLTGIANGSGNILSILSPLLVQLVVTDETDKSQWRIIFVTAAGVYMATNLFYVLFSTAEVQWWDTYSSDPKKDQKISSKTGKEKEMSQTSKTVNCI